MQREASFLLHLTYGGLFSHFGFGSSHYSRRMSSIHGSLALRYVFPQLRWGKRSWRSWVFDRDKSRCARLPWTIRIRKGKEPFSFPFPLPMCGSGPQSYPYSAMLKRQVFFNRWNLQGGRQCYSFALPSRVKLIPPIHTSFQHSGMQRHVFASWSWTKHS
jgi:hypothetical protein